MAGKTVTGTVTMNIFLSIFLGVSLKKVWMLMNTLQILTNIPLMAFALPSNVVFTFQTLIDLAKFNFIPKDTIKKYMNMMKLT